MGPVKWKEKLQIIRELDVEAATRILPLSFTPGPKDDGSVPSLEEFVYASLHKARCSVPHELTDLQLTESIEWLKGHGWRVPNT